MKETCNTLVNLFVDTTDAVVERARIKSQQHRIMEIVRIDKQRLQRVYAEIGKIYVNGGSKTKAEAYKKEVKRIEDRIARAELRYAELEKCDSVDECTQAIKEKFAELSDQVKESAGEKAQELAGLAKDKGGELAEKVRKTSIEVKEKAKDKAEDLTEKARSKTDEAINKAKKAVKDKKAKKPEDDAAKYLAADDKVLEDMDDIMKRIEAAMSTVDEEDEAPAEASGKTSEEESAQDFTF